MSAEWRFVAGRPGRLLKLSISPQPLLRRIRCLTKTRTEPSKQQHRVLLVLSITAGDQSATLYATSTLSTSSGGIAPYPSANFQAPNEQQGLTGKAGTLTGAIVAQIVSSTGPELGQVILGMSDLASLGRKPAGPPAQRGVHSQVCCARQRAGRTAAILT